MSNRQLNADVMQRARDRLNTLFSEREKIDRSIEKAIIKAFPVGAGVSWLDGEHRRFGRVEYYCCNFHIMAMNEDTQKRRRLDVRRFLA